MKPNIKVVNLKEFNAALRGLQSAARGDVVKKAALAGGAVVQAYARINAEAQFRGSPTGTLKESIAVEVEKSGPNSAWVNIGPTVIYGRIQELGGWIKPIHAKVLSWINEQGERVFAKKVYIPPRPYLRPALDEHMSEIEEAVGETLKSAIINAVKMGGSK